MPFVNEVAHRLAAQSVGTVGTNILMGSASIIPESIGDGPVCIIVETGGSAPTRIHNTPGAHTQRPTAQLTFKHKLSYTLARNMARAAYVALDGLFNTSIGSPPVFYQKITARQEPTDMGLMEGWRTVVFNIEAEKQLS